MPAWFAPAALMATLVAASVSDVRRLRVPAWLTIGSGLAALAYSGVRGAPGLEAALLGAAAGGLILLPLLKFGLGPADVLLLAGAGAWEGWRFALETAFFASFAGLLLAIGPIARTRRSFPYVPAIAVGASLAFLVGPATYQSFLAG